VFQLNNRPEPETLEFYSLTNNLSNKSSLESLYPSCDNCLSKAIF